MAATVSNPINSKDPNTILADHAAKTQNALWYTFDGIGRAYLIRRGSVAAGDADASRVHGYNTIEQAYKKPNIINALSQVTISQWNEWGSLPAGGGVFGVIETVNITAPTSPGQSPTVSTQQNPTTAAVSNVVANWEHVILRVAEALLGLVLIGVGIARISGAQNVVSDIVKTKLPIPV